MRCAPLVPLSSTQKNLTSAEFAFLVPLVESSKALKAFFAALPDMKRAAQQLAGGVTGRESEVAQTITAGIERAHAASVNRV